MRKPRKSRGVCRDVCASCASLAAFAVTFAQAAQVSRHLPWRLRKPRKSLGICRGVCASRAGSRGIYRGVCASRASLSAFAVGFAQAALGLSAFAVGFAVSVPPRVSPWAMVHRPYRPPRRPSIRARGPVWWGVCNTPLHRYGHSPRWGVYPANFAGASGTPAKFAGYPA